MTGKKGLFFAIKATIICLFLVLSFIATDEIYAQEGGTVTINYKMYLNDGETVTPMTEYGGTTISISKLDDNGNVDNSFRYENTTKGIYIYGGSGSVPVRNQNCNGQEDEKLVLDFLSKGKYRIDRKDRTAPKSFRKIGSSDDMSAAEKRNQIEPPPFRFRIPTWRAPISASR